MLVGIHKDTYGKFCSFNEKYETILKFNGIETLRVEACQPDFWEIVQDMALLIYRWRHTDDNRQIALSILPILEREMGINCFPNLATCWHFDDKIVEYLLLKQHGFPAIPCWIFWNKKRALSWVNKAQFPLVFKLKGGAGANNVTLVHEKRQAKKLIKRMFADGIRSGHIPDKDAVRYKDASLYKKIHKMGGDLLRIFRGEDLEENWKVHKNYVLFQKFLPNNDFDTRITVIGDRAFAFRRFTRNNDFRASGSGSIDYDMGKINLEAVKLAFSASKKLKFQSMAYDIILDDQSKPKIIEISYTYMDYAVAKCTGYWDQDLNWHEGHFWPQYCQLQDALNLYELKQPDLDI